MKLYHSIYHYRGCNQPRTPREVKDAVERDEYVKIAVVQCHSMDEAFALTQNIDQPWTMNPGVEMRPVPGPFRSTMPGDMISCCFEVYIVGNSGFVYLPHKAFKDRQRARRAKAMAEFDQYNARRQAAI
jgi:hypothetical protein